MEKTLFYIEDNMAFFREQENSFGILDEMLDFELDEEDEILDFELDEELENLENKCELLFFEVDLKKTLKEKTSSEQRIKEVRELFSENIPWLVGENKNGEYLQIFTGIEKSEFIRLIELSGGKVYQDY